MNREPIIKVPGVVPFQWTADGYMAALDAGLVKHSHLEMFEGIVVIDVWAPHGNVPNDSPGVDPYRWDVDEFLAILDAGLIEAPACVELLDGIMALKKPSLIAHNTLSPSDVLLMAPRVVLGHRSVCGPEYALLRPEAAGRGSPVRERDLLWALDVVADGFDRELSPRRDAYARAGIPHYWVLSLPDRRVWTFSRPEGGIYREESVYSEGETVELPGIGGAINTGELFLQG